MNTAATTNMTTATVSAAVGIVLAYPLFARYPARYAAFMIRATTR